MKSSNNVDMETKINHSWLLIYDDFWFMMDFFEDSTAQCKFSSFDWSGVSGSSQATLLFFVAGMGARGSGAICLSPLYLSAVLISALLCSVWWCLIRAPSLSFHPFSQPILCKPCTGLAQGLGFSGGAGKDRKGLDSAEFLKGPCHFLLKDHQIEMWWFACMISFGISSSVISATVLYVSV